jgi:spermidine/putrescine transport system substrate-binding protein
LSRAASLPVPRLLLAALWLLLGVPSLPAASKALNLFIWSEYIEPGVVAEFERRFDCKVTIDLYEDESAMMAKLQAGGASSYDVAVPPDHKVPVLAKLGLLAPLQRDRIPNLRNLEPRFLSPPYDPGNRVSVAYHWGTVGLYVRLEGGKPPPATWGLVFDPARQAGPFVLLDGPRDLIGAALKFRGQSLNTFEVGPLKEVRSLLVQAKRRSIGFDNSVGGRNKVLAGAARVAMVYSGEAARGVEEDKETAYLIPQEGSQIWVDNLVIPARAPHPRLGEEFINYLLEPAVAATNARFVRFATANRAARPLLPPEDLANPAIYPPQETMGRLEFIEDPGERSRLLDELWTSVKAR